MNQKRTLNLRPVGSGRLKPVAKTKMVNAWAFAVRRFHSWDICTQPTRDGARNYRHGFSNECRVGPIVRIEVPAPKDRKQ